MTGDDAGILFPLAKSAEGGQVWIKDAVRGGVYTCWECEGGMIAKLGEIKRWHFAHKVASGGGCGEGALHRAVKLGLETLISRAETLTLAYDCGQCRDETFGAEYPGPFLARSEDRSFAVGCRVDLGVYQAGPALLALEVVDTHRMTPETAAILKERWLPVWEVRANWELAHWISDQLAEGVPNLELVVSPALNITTPKCKDTCPQCGERIRERHGWHKDRLLDYCRQCAEQRRAEALAAERAAVAPPPLPPPPSPWEYQYPRPMDAGPTNRWLAANKALEGKLAADEAAREAREKDAREAEQDLRSKPETPLGMMELLLLNMAMEDVAAEME